MILDFSGALKAHFDCLAYPSTIGSFPITSLAHSVTVILNYETAQSKAHMILVPLLILGFVFCFPAKNA